MHTVHTHSGVSAQQEQNCVQVALQISEQLQAVLEAAHQCIRQVVCLPCCQTQHLIKPKQEFCFFTSGCPAWNQGHLSARGHLVHAARSGSASSPSREPCLHASSCQNRTTLIYGPQRMNLHSTRYSDDPWHHVRIIVLETVNICICSTG